MAPPTRPQIEAVITTPSYTVEYWNGSAWTALSDNVIIGVSGLVNAGGGSSGLDFGANASPRVTIELDDDAGGVNAAIAWTKTRVRVSYGFAGSDELMRMTGIIASRSRSYSDDSQSLVWEAAGFDELIRDTPMYSTMYYRRLAATATTASSVEDPTNGAYVGGLVNYIFWQSGGRPLAQSGTYPTAVFYYQCDNALIAPEWSWIAGEDGWQELDRLCRAVGGQVFQQPDGTMRFVNVLAPTAGSYSITDSTFQSISEDATTEDYFVAARCSYTARALQGTQVVYEDNTPRLVAPSGTLTFVLEPQLPVYSWQVSGASTIPAWCYVATDYFGRVLTPTVTYVSRAAARVEVSFVNTDSTRPMIISAIRLKGQPIMPVEEGQAKYGSGTPERAVGDGEIYVQSRTHAERLCRIYVDVYGVVRPTRKLEGMGYDPDRTLGEIVPVTLSAWGLSAVNHRITSIDVNETGATMSMSITPITGIPLTTDMFLIDQSYSGGDTRQLGY